MLLVSVTSKSSVVFLISVTSKSTVTSVVSITSITLIASVTSRDTHLVYLGAFGFKSLMEVPF